MVTSGNERSGSDRLMEQVVERSNVKVALKRVRENKGSPGIDGMTVDELPQHLVEHWEELRAKLLAGAYQRNSSGEVAADIVAGCSRARCRELHSR